MVCGLCSQIGLLKKETIANGMNEKLLNDLSIKKTCLEAFLGHTDATETTKSNPSVFTVIYTLQKILS